MKRGRRRSKASPPEIKPEREYLDYDFLAVRIMKEFGWSIEYVLSLSFPIFFDLFGLIKRARADAAIDEFYTPYAAVKFGGKCGNHLFNSRGSIMLDNPDKPKPRDCTPEMVKKANRKLKALIRARQAALTQAAK